MRILSLAAFAFLTAMAAYPMSHARAEGGVAFGAAEPGLLTLGLGPFDVNDNETSSEFRAEYRSDLRLARLTPFIGLLANSDGGVFGYAGLGLDILVGRRFLITPQAGFGGYSRGESKDLGGVFQFRTGVELALRFRNRARIGIAFHHISNAGLYDINPGTESLLVTFSIPVGAR